MSAQVRAGSRCTHSPQAADRASHAARAQPPRRAPQGAGGTQHTPAQLLAGGAQRPGGTRAPCHYLLCPCPLAGVPSRFVKRPRQPPASAPPYATLRGMYFTVEWTARVDGPGPQPGVPQWDEDSLVIGGTHYVQAEWSTITIYSDATPTEPPPREKTGDDPGE